MAVMDKQKKYNLVSGSFGNKIKSSSLTFENPRGLNASLHFEFVY